MSLFFPDMEHVIFSILQVTGGVNLDQEEQDGKDGAREKE